MPHAVIAFPRALSLTDHHCATLAALARSLPGAWSAEIERDEDGDRYACIVDHHRQDETAFMVTRNAGLVELWDMRGAWPAGGPVAAGGLHAVTTALRAAIGPARGCAQCP